VDQLSAAEWIAWLDATLDDYYTDKITQVAFVERNAVIWNAIVLAGMRDAVAVAAAS